MDAMGLTQPSLTAVIRMSSNGNIVKVTIGLAEKAGHCPLMYGLTTCVLMAQKPEINTGPYRQ